MATPGNIKTMHYNFKQKLNKLDSNSYRGLKIPDIDLKLNEALNLYLLLVAEPRIKNQMGFETIQRTINDILPVIVDGKELMLSMMPGELEFIKATLPDDYLYFLSVDKLLASKDDCKNQKMDVHMIKHHNKDNQQHFHSPDFDWRTTNIRFNNEGIRVYKKDFDIDKLTINYIKAHPYMHNAEDFNAGGYVLPDGTALTGFQDCILPDITHAEIVDLAVMLASGELEMPFALQVKQGVLSIRQILNK